MGDWLVRPAEDTVSQGGRSERLEPLAMEVLVYLASRAGEVVSRAELEEAVWKGGEVGYDSVTSTVTKLRKALGDNARNPTYIATVPKRGYQLIAPVAPTSEGQQAGRGTEHQGTPRPSVRSMGRKFGVFLGLVALTGLIWFGGMRLLPTATAPDEQPEEPSNELPSIVVLPFTNMGGDAEQDYFVDGVTEDIVTDLSRLSGLTIIAWSTSSIYKGTHLQPQMIGEELGVGYVVSGSIRKAGDQLRITAQLVDSASGKTLWAERYDRELTGIFALQDEVRRKIVSALAVQLTSQEEKKSESTRADNVGAYDAFLRGRRHFMERTKEAYQSAREAYREAIKLDPNYARAYGALAIVLTNEYRNDWTSATLSEAQARALELADRAVRLDPSSPQTQWAMGFVRLFREEYDEAAASAEIAVTLAPNYADGYGLLAFINNFRGQAEDAVRQIEKAMALNPNYPYTYPWNLGRAYYTLGRYRDAIEKLQQALTRNENAMYPRLFLAASYVRAGLHDDAEWEIEQIRVLNPNMTTTHLRNTFPIADKDSLQAFLDDLEEAGLPTQ